MINESIVECPVCLDSNHAPMVNYEKDHLSRCRRCGFVFSNIVPTHSEFNAVYSNYDYSCICHTPITNIKIEKMAVKLMQYRGKIENVLDIACGLGNNSIPFMKFGSRVYGTEFDEKLEAFGRDSGMIMLSGGTMPGKPSDIEGFDLIVFTEIIEHINNPRKVLNNIFELLSTGGLVYITTPNFSSLERILIGPEWGMINYPEHISYYSPKVLDCLLRTSGFEKVCLYTENISIFRIIQRVNKSRSNRKKRNLDSDLISAKAQKIAHGSILGRSAKMFANTLLNLFGAGTSIVAIYRKK